MTTETLRYAAIMLAAGIGIPVLAALNAQLGARIGSPPAAAIVLFTVAMLATVAVLLATGGMAALAQVPAQPKHLLLAGLLVAFYVLSITWVAPRFGVGNAIFCVLLGQLVSAAIIDHFGLMGAAAKPIDLTRAAGLGLMAAGVLLAQRV
jgi:transporter family-2 protein